MLPAGSLNEATTSPRLRKMPLPGQIRNGGTVTAATRAAGEIRPLERVRPPYSSPGRWWRAT
jgi:hypothetical protein